MRPLPVEERGPGGRGRPGVEGARLREALPVVGRRGVGDERVARGQAEGVEADVRRREDAVAGRHRSRRASPAASLSRGTNQFGSSREHDRASPRPRSSDRQSAARAVQRAAERARPAAPRTSSGTPDADERTGARRRPAAPRRRPPASAAQAHRWARARRRRASASGRRSEARASSHRRAERRHEVEPTVERRAAAEGARTARRRRRARDRSASTGTRPRSGAVARAHRRAGSVAATASDADGPEQGEVVGAHQARGPSRGSCRGRPRAARAARAKAQSDHSEERGADREVRVGEDLEEREEGQSEVETAPDGQVGPLEQQSPEPASQAAREGGRAARCEPGTPDPAQPALHPGDEGQGGEERDEPVGEERTPPERSETRPTSHHSRFTSSARLSSGARSLLRKRNAPSSACWA